VSRVTFSRRAESRNPIEWIPCSGCAKAPAVYVTRDASGAITSRKPISLHCLSCHESGHVACAGCGKCMPPWMLGRRSFGIAGSRHDQRHCSNACRQRAYRTRRAASGEEQES
jgi:hypothetical protein